MWLVILYGPMWVWRVCGMLPILCACVDCTMIWMAFFYFRSFILLCGIAFYINMFCWPVGYDRISRMINFRIVFSFFSGVVGILSILDRKLSGASQYVVRFS